MSGDGPVFYFDLASPDAYLAAERILATMPVATEWTGILARDLGSTPRVGIDRSGIERRAAQRGLQALRWPEPYDSAFAMHVATYAKSIGRVVAFSLAAFRQAFAGGRPLDADTVLLAAAACEMHPAAVLRSVELRGVREGLARATAVAAQRGVTDVPAVWTGDAVFHGDAALEHAANALAA